MVADSTLRQQPIQGGLGLTSLEERAAKHRGRLHIQTSAEQGTVVTVALPLNGISQDKT